MWADEIGSSRSKRKLFSNSLRRGSWENTYLGSPSVARLEPSLCKGYGSPLSSSSCSVHNDTKVTSSGKHCRFLQTFKPKPRVKMGMKNGWNHVPYWVPSPVKRKKRAELKICITAQVRIFYQLTAGHFIQNGRNEEGSLTTSAKAEMTFPSVVRDLLIFAPSWKGTLRDNGQFGKLGSYNRRWERPLNSNQGLVKAYKTPSLLWSSSHLQPGPFGSCWVSPLTPRQIHQADFADL